MRVGIFGGAFDPPHMGHVTVAAHALATGQIDLLWVIPCWGHGFDKKMSPFPARLAMARAAFEGVFGQRVQVKDFEARWQTKYTVDVVERLRGEFLGIEWVLVIGRDEFQALDRWHRADDLRNMLHGFHVVGRGEYRGDPEFVVPDVNSTRLREMIARFGTGWAKQLVPAPVLDTIGRYGLYRPNSPKG